MKSLLITVFLWSFAWAVFSQPCIKVISYKQGRTKTYVEGSKMVISTASVKRQAIKIKTITDSGLYDASGRFIFYKDIQVVRFKNGNNFLIYPLGLLAVLNFREIVITHELRSRIAGITAELLIFYGIYSWRNGFNKDYRIGNTVEIKYFPEKNKIM